MSTTPPHYPHIGKRVGHRPGPIAIAAITAVVILVAAVLTAVIVRPGTSDRPGPSPTTPGGRSAVAAVRLTVAGPIAVAQGISITPAAGWTLQNRGPNWVTLYNADSTARMQVEVKPAGGTDIVDLLEADVNRLTSAPSTGLTNVVNLSGPATKTVQGANFQQRASIDYTADVSTQQGTIPILGVFDELLNPSRRLSAFIDFRQDGDATTHAAADGGMMLNSML